MPKSKRDKKISLTKTAKKGLLFRQQLVDEIRRCVQNFSRIFVFTIQNMRNGKLKDLRTEWRHSRFFFGKNKVMAIGLGKTVETEVEDNLHKLAKQLRGQCGLLFTNKSRDEVLEWFANYSDTDFARSGSVATSTVVLPKGPLEQFPHSMEPHLRQLGMPTSLKKGVVTLREDYTVCTLGDVLKPEQARILKLLGQPMAEFKLTMKCVWSKDDGAFEKFQMNKKAKTAAMEEMEVEAGEDGDDEDGSDGEVGAESEG
ncbi:mRNA turnover protein 4 homolog [Anabrus simplex]|uniref:mRNA turnover protein 4 homolog n=1 Tax=Anabrus simplex TaxID=316456 RepID=UPI0034DD8179